MDINKDEVKRAIEGDRDAIINAFDWCEAPQGHGYWLAQYHGRTPIDVDTLRQMIGEDTKLTVGETYTARNGGKWECIFVRDGKAWMMHDGCTAYVWGAETGYAESLGGGEHNIVFPERRRGSVEFMNGEPQWDTWQEEE